MANGVKAVFFDLDNTLIDFLTMKRRSCEAAVDAMICAGVPLKKEEALASLYFIYKRVGMDDRKVFQRFLSKHVGRIDERILAAGIVAYRRERVKHYDPYPHTIPVLQRLRKSGFRLGIITDAPRLKAWMRLHAARLASLFDTVVTYEDTFRRKPAKQPFEAALDKLHLDPSDCVMVGDWPHRDIIGAKRMGMRTIFARYGNPDHPNPGADFSVNTMIELEKTIRSLK